jgi:hypothetical protein
MKLRAKIAIGVVLVWAGLFFSSRAVLVWSEMVTPAHGAQASMQCTFFTGVGVVTAEYWYSANGMFGRAACPRIVRL